MALASKRKRIYYGEDYGMGRKGSGVYATGIAKRRKKSFVPGRDRRVGFYGRYAVQNGGGELKFHDVNLTDAVIAQGGIIQDTVIVIAQGVTESQRIGRKCTLRSIHWKYRISIPEIDAADDPSGGDDIRVILYLDKQCNGTAAATLDILETASIHSFRNLANSGRFTILMDKLHVMNYTTLASDNAAVVSSAIVRREYTFNKKCSIPIEYSATTGAIGEIRSNNIGVLLVALSGVGGINSEFRFRFSDN